MLSSHEGDYVPTQAFQFAQKFVPCVINLQEAFCEELIIL
jgi:hypothetical protein